MTAKVSMSRGEAELVVDLLEQHFDATQNGIARDLAVDIRKAFGMVTRERELQWQERESNTVPL